MKKLALFAVLLTAAFLLFGCQDSSITGSEPLMTDNEFVPFKGNLEGVAVTSGYAYPVPKLLTVEGNATHTGKFSAVVNYFITYNNFNQPTGGDILGGTGTLIAADGDEIHLSNVYGAWEFESPTNIFFTLNSDISGGTGRFLGATGEFSGTGSQIYDQYSDPTPTVYSWTGTISY